MGIKLQDTLSRSIKEIKPSKEGQFRFYCCGPTVYGPAHIGNFRTFLVQDVFRRVIELGGMKPYQVRNLTDVDDKTIRGAQKEGVPLNDFTQKWTKKFHEDCEALNMLKPEEEPTATGHIKEQIAMIEVLIERGHAYVGKDGSVYYKVKSFKDYGKLAHLNLETLKTQDETSGGAANLADEYDRENVADFALWKAHKEEDGENAWDSPWGRGRPGWHIECSAMSHRYLGDTFDLHAGGIDLCFPHHENEIAQSEGATGKPMCKHWFHSAHLQVEGEKMSKSLGNLFTVDDIKEKGYSPNVLRYLLISGHYQQPFNFTMDGLGAARSAIHKLEKLAKYLLKKANLEEKDFQGFLANPLSEDWGSFKAFWDALCDNLNVPQALGKLFEAARDLEHKDLSVEEAKTELKALGKALYALGIKLFAEEKKAAPDDVKALADLRLEARRSKDFAKSDELRDKISAQGWNVLDRKDGYDLEPIEH